jgi:hypothetical protein
MEAEIPSETPVSFYRNLKVFQLNGKDSSAVRDFIEIDPVVLEVLVKLFFFSDYTSLYPRNISPS